MNAKTVQFIPSIFLAHIAGHKNAIAISYEISIPAFYSDEYMEKLEINKLLRDILLA